MNFPPGICNGGNGQNVLCTCLKSIFKDNIHLLGFFCYCIYFFFFINFQCILVHHFIIHFYNTSICSPKYNRDTFIPSNWCNRFPYYIGIQYTAISIKTVHLDSLTFYRKIGKCLCSGLHNFPGLKAVALQTTSEKE